MKQELLSFGIGLGLFLLAFPIFAFADIIGCPTIDVSMCSREEILFNAFHLFAIVFGATGLGTMFWVLSDVIGPASPKGRGK